MIAYRLTGSRCRCASCGEYFNSVSIFDRHRVGLWDCAGKHRRCLSVDEMRRRGWLLNPRRFWIERRRLDDTRSRGDLGHRVGQQGVAIGTVLHEAS
jgi:hypothetical protein